MMERLFRPKSVAVIGGGGWCTNVIRQLDLIGFTGPVWHVHPSREGAFRSINDLPHAPDAAFVGVNRAASIEAVATLSARGAGGAVCFASGFTEALAEMADGAELQAALVAAAGDMPILGPNCYGFVNALDRVALWPDVHGMLPCDGGVALLGQSSNVMINLTMQTRGLPIAYAVTVGNQAQTGVAAIGRALLADPRVTALGMHIEGFSDLRGYEALAALAHDLGKPVVVMKVGSSEQAQAATVSHTASLAGSDAGARTLLARLGFAQVGSPSALLETLKIMHVTGGLATNRIGSMSCSGGEASLMADLGAALGVVFPTLDAPQRNGLRSALGPKVALANPLDYHTYIWGKPEALADCFTAMMAGDLAMGCVVLDYPRTDRFDPPEWGMVVDAVIAAKQRSGKPMAIIASMAEGMPEAVAAKALAAGIVPLNGMADALTAIAASVRRAPTLAPLILPNAGGDAVMLDEATSKQMLGVRVPLSASATRADASNVAEDIGYPVVVKSTGLAHKTEAGGVRIGLRNGAEVAEAVAAMTGDTFLIEEMITDPVAELLIGVVNDPAHGFVLTLGAGGVMTELWADTTSLLLPVDAAAIRQALAQLRTYPLLTGYRGNPAADIDAIVDVVLTVQAYVQAHRDTLQEVEINPLICRMQGAIAVDALIRTKGQP